MRSVITLLVILVTSFPVWCRETRPANVYGITLDRNVLRGETRSRLVKVWTLAADPENDPLVFVFTVSAGRILGAERRTGAMGQIYYSLEESGLRAGNYEAIWDLSDALPGEHKITVGVDDGCGLCGMTRTQTVQVDPTRDETVELCPISFRTVWAPAWTKSGGWFLRLLAVPAEGELYETIPSLKWKSASNWIGSRNGSPLAESDLLKNQQLLQGSFVRDPIFTSPFCDIASEFSINIPKFRR